jgi:1,2-dihydroxy-3-keto-5-methylthiopentene dioxygenase
VRFVIQGAGLFHIHPQTHTVFALQLEAGDLISVPAGTRHWFDLCADRMLRAIRLFKDPAGWVPHYVRDGVHGEYAPLCWGPQYLRAEAGVGHTR